MPSYKEVSWSQLRVGVMLAIAILVLVVGIFFVGGRVGFFQSRYKIEAYFPGVEGLTEGAAVQLAGVPVGNVSWIRLSPYQDPNRAVAVTMKIDRRFAGDIRADSVASITTFGLLGQSFVDITRGSQSQPQIPTGGLVKSVQQADMKRIVQNANDVLTNMTGLSSKLNEVSSQITNGKGTVGKLIYDPSLYNELNSTVSQMHSMMSKVSNGQGTLGELISNDELYHKIDNTLDRANQMMDQIQHGNGTVAKLLNDPSAYDNLNKTIVEARNLMTDVNAGKGTIGKLATDSQLYDRLNEIAGNVNTVTGRMAQGQGSLGMLSTNSALYNNLTESSASLREFLTEFRKSPKKYLTLRLHIF
ncbi:MAG: MCE family protein [Acidobacteriota bacterium]|nr:MCE family protein [Acidobacteriota bacterium]